jgi:hypothetical protein
MSVYIHDWKRFLLDGHMHQPRTRVLIPWAGLWKTHNFYSVGNKAKKKIIYIVRHPVNVLYSLWKMMDPLIKKDRNKFIGPVNVRTWARHARGYSRNCFYVRYEDLISEKYFNKMMVSIEDNFGLERKNSEFNKIVDHLGWYPNPDPTQSLEAKDEVIANCVETLPAGYFGYDLEKPGEFIEGGRDAKL